ncbi:MAG: substrate-binding domain-containing protein [Myxococcaceae bacterium]
MSRFFGERLGALLALVGLCLLFGALSPRFFEIDNFINVARQISINGVIAVGMTLIIVSSGIDLSVGSVLALSICVAGVLMQGGTAAPVALSAGLVVGLACGAVNGLVITRLGISPFIATLGMMSIARGAAMVATGGNPVTQLDKSYFFIGTGSFLGVPVPVWLMAAVVLAGAFLLERTRTGRYALALGSNEEAVRLAGVSVNRYKLVLYVLMGGLAAIAGWILSARVASADPSAGALMELEAIAAVVIGGASLKGGRGSVAGTLIGAAIMGVLNNGLVLLGISAFWQQVLVGLVIIGAVGVDGLKTRALSAAAGGPWLRYAGIGVALALVLTSLGMMVFRPKEKPQNAPGRRLTIAFLPKAAGGEYWLSVKTGAERKGKELGVDVLWLAPASETEVSKQIDIFENVIQTRPDGIALAPTDAQALSPIARKAVEAGIPVVTVDSDTEAKDRLTYIGTDNHAAGEVAGREMVKLLGGKGKVAIITGVLGAKNLRQRCEGFKAGVAGSGLEVLTEQTDNGDRAKGLAVAENLMTANPDLVGFFADNAIAGPAVAQALIGREQQGKVKLISFDTTPALLGYVHDGVAQRLVAQKPEKMGELGVELLVRKLRGEAIPPAMDTGVVVVTEAP